MTSCSLRWLSATFLTFFLGLIEPATFAKNPVSTPPAVIQGTFLQLLNAHNDWKNEQWIELFGYLKKLHISQIVLQWTVYDQTAFYPSQHHQTISNPPLETILRLADEENIHVSIGLIHDSDFWKKIGHRSADLSPYLQSISSRSTSTATELSPILRKHPSFKGWYITQEIDDLNWRTPEAQTTLFSHLRDLSSFLHVLTPNAHIAISGFANAGTDPKFLKEFWTTLLQKAPAIDQVWFQDGIGVGKLKLATLPPYLGAVQNAAISQKREFRTIVEIFRQVGGPPINTENFHAIPASIEQILNQLNAAAPYSCATIAFSVPEYMSPLGGHAASELYDAYLSTLQKNNAK